MTIHFIKNQGKILEITKPIVVIYQDDFIGVGFLEYVVDGCIQVSSVDGIIFEFFFEDIFQIDVLHKGKDCEKMLEDLQGREIK